MDKPMGDNVRLGLAPVRTSRECPCCMQHYTLEAGALECPCCTGACPYCAECELGEGHTLNPEHPSFEGLEERYGE